MQILFGRYIIHRLLGMGGMAEIYQATVSGPGGFEKPVVIKRVRSQYARRYPTNVRGAVRAPSAGERECAMTIIDNMVTGPSLILDLFAAPS